MEAQSVCFIPEVSAGAIPPQRGFREGLCIREHSSLSFLECICLHRHHHPLDIPTTSTLQKGAEQCVTLEACERSSSCTSRQAEMLHWDWPLHIASPPPRTHARTSHHSLAIHVQLYCLQVRQPEMDGESLASPVLLLIPPNTPTHCRLCSEI